MIVTVQKFREVATRLLTPGERSFDCETTGLKIWQDDRLFSLIISDETHDFYFNFHAYEDMHREQMTLEGIPGGFTQHHGPRPEQILPRSLLAELTEAFSNEDSTWVAHNAKYDMACLSREGIEIKGKVFCTMAQGRVERNDRFNYDLDSLAGEIGFPKDDAVAAYCKAHGLFRFDGIDAKGNPIKVPQYYRVPFDIIVPYGERDARITLELYKSQKERIHQLALRQPPNVKTPVDIMYNEMQLTKTFFEMEKTGILIDRDYVSKACKHEAIRVAEAMGQFKDQTGIDFVDSAKTLKQAFDVLGEKYPLTEKGNPSFKADVLAEFKSPIAKLVLDYRDASKNLNTYYRNFLKYADANGRIHANAKQGGTETGRVSYAEPNLQNLPKEEDLTAPFLVRRSFIPSPGNIFAMLDYDQVEYRLMLDYSGQLDLIEKIINDGLDVHEATAQMMGVTRQQAKTLNFMLLYGGGVAKLCVALFNPLLDIETLKTVVDVHLWEKRARNMADSDRFAALRSLPDHVLQHDIAELLKAKELLDQYFERLPKVREFTKGVISVASTRGWIRNAYGRVCFCANKQYAYALPNHLIQGGCGDGMKVAMNRIQGLLERKKARSKMVLQVHDELDFDMVRSELDLIPEIKALMETAYPYKHIPLTVGVEYSARSLADKQEELPA